MVFNKKKNVILIGYLLAPLLIPVFLYYRIAKLDAWFWVPLIFFTIASSYVVYLTFKKNKE